MKRNLETYAVDLRTLFEPANIVHHLVLGLARHVQEMPAAPVKLASLSNDVISFEAGRFAREAHKALLANPYDRKTWDWHAWRSGWMEADLAEAALTKLAHLMHRRPD